MTIVPAELAMCAFGIVVIIALFLFFVVWYVASPYESIDKKFAWYPIRLWREDRPNVWVDTHTWAWLELVGVRKTLWGGEVHYRLK